MFIIRNVMHCKPGKAKEMVTRFHDFQKAVNQMGGDLKSRVMTDVSGERFWTVISEIEVKSIEDHGKMREKIMSDPNYNKTLGQYHDIVESGRREIYKIEE